MDFVAVLNKNILLLSLSIATMLLIGLVSGYKGGGWNRNLVYLWTLLIYTVYVFVTPLHYYLSQKNVVVGTDISAYYGMGFFFNFVAIIFFIIGYWIKGSISNKTWTAPAFRELRNPKRIITYLFYGCYAIVLINLAIGGANIQQVFLGDEIVGMGASGGSFFLQNFTDSLICIIVLAYIFEVPWRHLLFWIFAAFFLFSLLGFRYRIVLSLFGILFVYLLKNRVTPRRVFVGFMLGLIFFYGVMFSTENRKALILRKYDNMSVNPLDFQYERFFEQTRGALPDMAVYRLYDNPAKEAKYDYGLTMFGYVFIRMIPRAIYPDKDRFYPPPQLATTIKAYDAWWAKFSGEATLSVAAFYIAFGWLGIVFGHFFWGLLIRRFADSLRRADKIHIATYIVIALATFQWVTRGYLPQIIDQLVYMMIPIWVLRYFSKKIKVENN